MSVCLSAGLQMDRVPKGGTWRCSACSRASLARMELQARRDLNQTLGIHDAIKHLPESCPAD